MKQQHPLNSMTNCTAKSYSVVELSAGVNDDCLEQETFFCFTSLCVDGARGNRFNENSQLFSVHSRAQTRFWISTNYFAHKMSADLVKVAKDNFDYFNASGSNCNKSFSEKFRKIIEVVTQAEPIVEQVRAFAPVYDFDQLSPYNGYRGLVYIFEVAVSKTLNLNEKIQSKRESFWFRTSSYRK